MTDSNGRIVVDPYSTNMPLLAAAVAATAGPVIELGSGLYSTPLLQALCLAQRRQLATFDNDRAWLQQVWHDHASLHTAHVVSDWRSDLHRYGEMLRCDVCLIDLAPAEDRGPMIEVMKRWARIIVVHDVEVEQRHNYPGVETALASFKYRIEDRRRGPWTAAASDDSIILQLQGAI